MTHFGLTGGQETDKTSVEGARKAEEGVLSVLIAFCLLDDRLIAIFLAIINLLLFIIQWQFQHSVISSFYFLICFYFCL